MNELFTTALGEYGISEKPGKGQHNARILKYFSEIGHEWVENDETAWCSAFINWCAKMNCLERSNKLNARSWLDIGEVIEEPQQGDIVIFWRESKDSWKGHVAIFVAKRDKTIFVLGGNQANMVKITGYSQDRLLGYRRLRKLAE